MKNWNELSRLPREQAYWSALQQRVVREATQRPVPERDPWLHAAVWTSALATAATVVLLLASRTAQDDPALKFGLTPSDPVAVQLFAARRPPPIDALLPAYTQPERP